ncbi:VQ motif-containing protein 31-like [Curcuma longa]|uniref:VQ motif-containing protein 31-like n=1 Tax=Curcuma longa TaxID=136217 RepID=UPI003D9EE7C3
MEKPPSAPAPPSTTFVQADAATFKELVQRLTGPDWPPHRSPTRNSQDAVDAARLSGVKRLHERRSGGSRLKVAVPKPAAGSASKRPASPAVPSPASSFARLDIRKEEEAAEGGDEEVIVVDEEEEERAIKERRFYLHPSPRSRTRMAEPDLLPLFPLTSPEAGDREDHKNDGVLNRSNWHFLLL